MALLSDLNGFCDWLRAQVSGQVAVGKPDNTVSGVYIWPWRIAVDSPTKNLPPPRKPREASVTAPSIYHVHFLLLATPTDSPAGLASLEIAQQAIHGNPILDAAGHRVQVIEETISVRDLAAIFMAAKLELTVCIAYVLTPL
jgi:hypothetical protein